MHSATLLFLLACVPLVWSASTDLDEDTHDTVQYTYPVGDVRNCPSRSPHNDQPFYLMSALSGAGFDNLRNVDRGRVFQYNYSLCRVSEDGKYLLPDNIFLIPIKESRFESFAEYFDHWDNYTSTTATSINIAGGFGPVNGKYSREYMMVKTHQVHDNAKTTRVQMRYKLYQVMLQPDSPLHPTFKNRLFDIAAHLQNNNTEYAHYLAEVVVRDFGTHFVTSVDAGAVFTVVDHVSSSYVKDLNHETKKIAASASASFFGRFSVGFGYSRTATDVEEEIYLHNRTHSELLTIGGPPYTSNLTVEEWEEGVPNNMVAIDRSGKPLHFAITPATLPELPDIIVWYVANTVYKAIETYYKVNTHQGCIDPGSPNFYFQANVNDGSCNPPTTNFTFGGVYQTCQSSSSKYDFCSETPFGAPQPLAQTNPLTGDYSCPTGYTPIQLYEGTVEQPGTERVCRKWCHSCFFLGRCCHTKCVNEVRIYYATYQIYWCAALQAIPKNSGYLFGGVYSQNSANQLTGTMGCPAYFLQVNIGRDIKVCISDDYELGFVHSVNFAGFASCKRGNPLAVPKGSPAANSSKLWPQSCPQGYAQHLVSVEDGCSINYCVQAGSFSRGSLTPAILPPFEKVPYYNHNNTGTQVIIGSGGYIWAKTPHGNWRQLTEKEAEELLDEDMNTDDNTVDSSSIEDMNMNSSIDSSSSHDGDLSWEGTIGVNAAVTIVLCTLIALVVFTGFWIRKRIKNKGRGTSESDYRLEDRY